VWCRKGVSDLVWIRNIQKICQNPNIVHTYIVYYREKRRNRQLFIDLYDIILLVDSMEEKNGHYNIENKLDGKQHL